jgi:hypothetical protein
LSNTSEKREYGEAVHQLFIDLKKSYDSVRREVLYNTLIECGTPMKIVIIIQMCLNKHYSIVQVGRHLCDMFPTKNGLKKEDALSRGSGKPGWFEIKWYTSASGLC